jgi:uncharacterized protein YjbI with pentapeptide repeats
MDKDAAAKSRQFLTAYKTGRHDFSGADLRRNPIKGIDPLRPELGQVDFDHANSRGADFTGPILNGRRWFWDCCNLHVFYRLLPAWPQP